MWSFVKRLWAKEPKRIAPTRSLEMQSIYETEFRMAQEEADYFNRKEKARYDREVAEQDRYMKEQQKIIDQCKAEGMSSADTIRYTIGCGYGPRINMIMPPAEKIVI